ncbi:MAG: hypothetical protein ACK46Y_16765 [Fluviicola sp.]
MKTFYQQKFYLKIAVLAIILTSLFGFSKHFSRIYSNSDPAVAGFDAFGYYMYLPHLVQKGHLNISQDWLEEVQEKRYGFSAYQLAQRENGNRVNIYHMGLSYVQAPAFFVGHGTAYIFGYKTDGLSKPYVYAMLLNALLFLYLGLFYLYKFLCLFFNSTIAITLVLLSFFATNLLATSYVSFMMQHVYLFSLISVFCYHFFKAFQSETIDKKHFYISVVVFGLCTVVRPTHVLLYFIPVLYLWNYFDSRKSYFINLLLFPISSFIWNIPQFLYWKIIGGSWLLTNLHTEEIILVDPYIFEFLFSYRKGWFLYTPLFLLLFPAFYFTFKESKRIFWSVLVTLIVCIWVFSSWECWHYAASFGSRVMIDLYPICLLIIGFLFKRVLELKFNYRFTFFGIIVLISVLNCFQSYQIFEGVLSDTSMTKSYYWKVFGKTHKVPNTEPYLIIDRNDLNWPEKYTNHQFVDLRLKNTQLLNLNLTNQITDSKIASICLLDKLKTDESQLIVTYNFIVKDSNVSFLGKCEVESKFNTYNWNSLELTLGKPKNKLLQERLIFNLPEIRHKKDSLMVYISSVSPEIIEMKSIQINAISLIRKD